MARAGQTSQNTRPQDAPLALEAADPVPGTTGDDTPSVKVSNMSYSEMVGFYHQQMARVEMAWFRIMYLHAAIVGVLVFFSQADDFLTLQRGIVFAFYTVNLLIFHVALSEGYAGLAEAQKDLRRFPDNDGHVDRWLRSRTTLYKTGMRSVIVIITWLLVGFLLFRSLLLA